MGFALTPVFFYDIEIEVSEVISASWPEFFGYAGKTLEFLGPGRLEKYDDRPGHFLYTFSDGEWLEFQEN